MALNRNNRVVYSDASGPASPVQKPVTEPKNNAIGGSAITMPVAPVYQVNNMAYPTYTSPTTGKQYSYNVAAPTWQWDDSGRPGEWQWNEAKPTYTNQYQDQINSMVDAILNREKFSYDYNTDPLYKMYAEAYTRNGQQAMKDTYAQQAARTGGLGSSYAGTAAQSQYNQYMNALNDKVPELYKIAYGMYQDEGNTMRNNLGMIQGLENTDYSRYQDALGQWNTDRNFSYGQYQDEWDRYYNDRDFSYNRFSDDWNRWDTNRNWDYNLWSDNLSRQEAAAQQAYRNAVSAYNANQARIDQANRDAQAKYDSDMQAYQQQRAANQAALHQQNQKKYDADPNATIQAFRNSGNDPVVTFWGKTYNLNQSGRNGIDDLIGQINNMPFSAAKKQQLMDELQKYGV